MGIGDRNTWKGLFGRSGGVGYHLAAAVYARGLWAPFRAAISVELERRIAGFDRASMHLVVIGSSGGYSLEPAFLRGFGAVTVVDIDPLAGFIFRRRVGRGGRLGGRVSFVRQDFFAELERAEWDLARWWGVVLGEPSAKGAPVFLFSNLLGQLQYLFEGQRFKEVSQGLAKAIQDVNWISYHDRLSVAGEAGSESSGITAPLSAERRLSPEEIARHFFPPRSGDVSLEAEEHEIGGWVDTVKGEFTYLPWRLTTQGTQIIEVCGNWTTG